MIKKSLPLILLVLIFIGAFIVRLYKLDSPVADWHSWRQADTAAVARNFYQEGFNPLEPKGDDMSTIGENQPLNLQRYRYVEFPIYGSLTYLGYLLNQGVDERIARLINILFSLGSLGLIYLITKKHFNQQVALLAAGLYAFLPFNVFFSRTILPEPSLVCFSLGMFYFLERWIEEANLKSYLLAILFTSLAFLTKPTAAFYLLPLIYTAYLHRQSLWRRKWWVIGLGLGVLPFGLWRYWMLQHPEGIPAARWLLNGNNIRFKPVFWKWILEDRFGREILSNAGTILMVLGLLIKPLRLELWTLHLFAVAIFSYLIVFATGNVQHDYYQYLIIPAVVIFTARGFWILWQGLSNFVPRIVTVPVSVLLLVLTFYLTWGEIKGLYQVNNYPIVLAGQEARKVLPANAVVIAPYQGDTAFLYQIDRPGFPFEFAPIRDMVEHYGVTHYVTTVKNTRTSWLKRNYTVVSETEQYVIIDLTRPTRIIDLSKDPEPQ